MLSSGSMTCRHYELFVATRSDYVTTMHYRFWSPRASYGRVKAAVTFAIASGQSDRTANPPSNRPNRGRDVPLRAPRPHESPLVRARMSSLRTLATHTRRSRIYMHLTHNRSSGGKHQTENWFARRWGWSRAYFFWTAMRSSDAPTPTSRYLAMSASTSWTLLGLCSR